jgi:hypothetical protein
MESRETSGGGLKADNRAQRESCLGSSPIRGDGNQRTRSWGFSRRGAMTTQLQLKDVTSTVLDYQLFAKKRLSPLYEFFQFWRYPRTFSNAKELSGVTFCDLSFELEPSGASEQPMPSGWHLFGPLFREIITRLMARSGKLCLFVKGMDRTYFDELETIDNVLVPRNLSYVLLPPSAPFKKDAPVRLGAGHLIFEWPSELLDEVPRKWFHSPGIEIEGYIGKDEFLGQIARIYFEPDTELRIRELLTYVDIGFRVRQDNDGLFLVSQKLNMEALSNLLGLSQLNLMVQQTIGLKN